MEKGFFITGTDTGVGKTWCSVALMHYFKKLGKTVIGMKPVASGCEFQNDKLRNEDALQLQAFSSFEIPYDSINPYALELPVSPHIAARKAGIDIEKTVILEKYNQLNKLADIVIVEGVGGWHAPINETEDVSDLASMFQLPVILVVAIRLGCLNHAFLTSKAINSSELQLAGWIAVHTDPAMPAQQENIDTLKEKLPCPFLGELPYIQCLDFEMLSNYFEFKF